MRGIDFSGKSVVDVGCWDGYFSFLMEQLGAASVLAVDDFLQNWGSAECFRLAHEIYHSNITLMPDVLVHDPRCQGNQPLEYYLTCEKAIGEAGSFAETR